MRTLVLTDEALPRAGAGGAREGARVSGRDACRRETLAAPNSLREASDSRGHPPASASPTSHTSYVSGGSSSRKREGRWIEAREAHSRATSG